MRLANVFTPMLMGMLLANAADVRCEEYLLDAPLASRVFDDHGHQEHAHNQPHGCGYEGACGSHGGHENEFCCGSYGGNFCEEIFDPVSHTHFSRRGTPLIHLFFLEPAALHRDLFVDYRIGNNVDGSADEQELETELEWALTKRLGLVIELPFLSLNPDDGRTTAGFGDLAIAGRALLVDGDETMLAVNLAVSTPTGDDTRGLGAGEAVISPTVSIWQDLGDWYSFHAQFGPEIGLESGQTEMFWAAALTKSFQGPAFCRECHHAHHDHHDDHFSCETDHGEHLHFEPGLTSFILELNGSTGLSEPNDGQTFFEMIPGISYVPWEMTELRFGVRFPLYQPERLDNQLIFSYIRNF